jgi:hypothetical protein
MPYIDHTSRINLDPQINKLTSTIRTVCGSDNGSYFGVLNYCITKLILDTVPGKRYWIIAGVTGVLQNIITEFYRRYAVPYEDEKIEQNGDVYEPYC